MDNNSASYEKGLVENGNPTTLQTGDTIYIQPGTEASVYHETQDRIDAGKGLVLMPVVDCDISAKSSMIIRGFVAFQLTGTTNSSVTGHFVNFYQAYPGSTPVPPDPLHPSNAVTPPLMVQ